MTEGAVWVLCEGAVMVLYECCVRVLWSVLYEGAVECVNPH